MGGLCINRADQATNGAFGAAEAHFALHGFAAGTDASIPGWTIRHFAYISGGPDLILTDGDDLVAVAGTFSFDGLMGRPALAALLRSADLANGPPALDWSRLGGHFVALLRKGGRSFLFTDYLAAYQLFHDSGHSLFATSLLAAAAMMPTLRFDAQGIYEFAFNVMPIGNDTIFSDLRTLGPNHIVELTPAGSIVHQVAKPLPAQAVDQPIEDRLALHRDRLHAIVEAHVRQFGDHIQCPLSGGLDSRLVLAALRAAGARPNIYVYGPPDSPDVAVARAIGDAMGFPVEWVHKEARTLDRDAFAEQVRRNFHLFDATPTFGNIFDNGGHVAARDARHAGGALAASGGCGEVYRDFFFLPDRPISAATVADSFFARFNPPDTTGLFDARTFLQRIREKIRLALDLPDSVTPVSRTWIEQAYPRVRCRALFGREISLESRHGAYLMPFLEHRVVAEAMTLPMPLKQAGRFEAMLLNAIDPALARQPSAYGHDFAGPPSRRHRFNEWSSRIRPVWLRRNSYAIKRRLRPMADEHGGLLNWDYMSQVLDPAFPAMRRYFRMDRITDSGLWRRIACLEYLAGQLGSRLAE